MTRNTRHSERGNVFTALLAAVAMTGVISVIAFNTLSGPVSSMARIVKKNEADTQMLAVSKIAILDASNQAASGDCDADGSVEPREWRTGTPAPTGGGLVPLNIGAPTSDPWSTDYGYCVWDVGSLNDPATDNGCGAPANRLVGSPTPSTGNATGLTILAIISAGPNKQFQTTCNDYVDADIDGSADADLITAGGDDVIKRFTYAEAAQIGGGLWTIKVGDPETATIGKDLEIGAPDTTGINLGVTTGNIIATGGIKPGDETTADLTCAAGTNIGMIRYNTTTPGLEVCNGAAGWEPAGPGWNNILEDQTVLTTCNAGATGAVRYNDGGVSGISVVQVTTTKIENFVVSSSHSFATLPTSGNTIVVVIAMYDQNLAPTEVMDNQGNTYALVAAETSRNISSYIYAASNIGAPGGTFTITVDPISVNEMAWGAMEVSGLANSSVVDQTGTYAFGCCGTTATVTASGPTTQAPEFVVALHAYQFNSAIGVNYGHDMTWTEPFLNNDGLGHPGMSTVYKTLSAVATPSHVWTYNNPGQGANQVSAVIATFKAASTGAPNVEFCDGAGWTNIADTGGGGTDINSLDDAIAAYNSANNIGLGSSALISLTTGTNNTALGPRALRQNTDGTYNTAIGDWTLDDNQHGDGNTAVGTFALQLSTADSNTAVGFRALHLNTTGTFNTAVGYEALASNTLWGGNTAVGYRALSANTSFSYNTAVGTEALSNATASQNTAVGFQALYQNTTGTPNTAVGYQALRQNTTGISNTAIGDTALNASINGDGNTAVGSYALRIQSGAGSNTAIGYRAGYNNTTGGMTAVGADALYSNVTGAINTAVGYRALYANTASNNVAIGSYALDSNTTGNLNTAVGVNALTATLTATNNTAVGYNALAAATANSLTAVGSTALDSNTTGGFNTAVGFAALTANTTAASNTAVGVTALGANTTGAGNTAVGHFALSANTGGISNIGIGYNALAFNSTGDYNIGIGETTGPASGFGNLDNTISIGKFTQVSASNRLNIGDTIFGDLSTKSIGINTATIGTGVRLHVLEGVANDTDWQGTMAVESEGDEWQLQLATNEGRYSGMIMRTYNSAASIPRRWWGMFNMNEFGTDDLGNPGMGFQIWEYSDLDDDGTACDSDGGLCEARFVIHYTGAVGIGTDAPDQGMVEVKGGSVCVDTNGDDNATQCITSESDLRLKKNVKTIDSALDKISRLRGVEFDWRWDEHDIVSKWVNKPHGIGVIAQEVEEVFPEAMGEEDQGFKTVEYRVLVAPLIEAVKELKSRTEAQQKQIETLTTVLYASIVAFLFAAFFLAFFNQRPRP